MAFSFDEPDVKFDLSSNEDSSEDDSRTIGDLIDAVNSNWLEYKKLHDSDESDKRFNRISGLSEDNSSKNISEIVDSLNKMHEHQLERESKQDLEKAKSKEAEEEAKSKKPVTNSTSSSHDRSNERSKQPVNISKKSSDNDLTQFSKVNVQNLEDVFRKLNMGRVVQNLDQYTSSINKYVEGMNTVLKLGSSMFSSFNSRLSSRAASDGTDISKIVARPSVVSDKTRDAIEATAKQAIDKVVSSVPSNGATGGSDADTASQQAASVISDASKQVEVQADKSKQTTLPDLLHKATKPIQNRTVEDAGNIAKTATDVISATAKSKVPEEAATAATKLLPSAAGAATEAAAGGGMLGSIGGTLAGVVTKLNPWVAGATAVGALAKAGIDEYREAQKTGNQFGGGAGLGMQMQVDNGMQDLSKFFGLSSVSGKQLSQYRQAAGDMGFSYGSEAFNASVELKKNIADSGLPDSMTNLADNMLKNGKSASEVSETLDSLKETSKTTGQSLDLISKSAAKAASNLDKVNGEGSGAKSANEAQENVVEALKRTGINSTASVADASGLISNSSFANALMLADPSKAMQLHSETGRYAYLKDSNNKDKIEQALKNLAMYNSIPGASSTGTEAQQQAQWMNIDHLEKSGISSYINNYDKFNDLANDSSLTSSRPSTAKEDKKPQHVKVDIGVEPGFMAKVQDQQNQFKRLYSGSDSMEIGK